MMIGFARIAPSQPLEMLDLQLRNLEAAGVTKFFSVIADIAGSSETIKNMLDFSREEDVIVITSLDRLVANVRAICEICDVMTRKGIAFQVIEIGLDTRTPDGKGMLRFLPILDDLRRITFIEAQRTGIDAARSADKYKGRKPTARAKTPDVLNAYRLGRTIAQITRDIGIGRASVYRILETNGLWAKRVADSNTL